MHDQFYRKFEDRFRGTKEHVKLRLNAYLPIISKIQETFPNSNVLDLGCGRGEWLELMIEKGFTAVGVDSNFDMLDTHFSGGAKLVNQDLLSYVKECPPESFSVVSAFHVIEHLSFTDLLDLVFECSRVLLPGGILIFETPNPENIEVSTNTFYLDPTHQKPIPHALLAFICEYAGFSRYKLMRLNSSDLSGHNLGALRLIMGVGRDYAIVSQKQASQNVLNFFDSVLNAREGSSLLEIAAEVDRSYQLEIMEIQKKIRSDIEFLNHKNLILEKKINELRFFPFVFFLVLYRKAKSRFLKKTNE